MFILIKQTILLTNKNQCLKITVAYTKLYHILIHNRLNNTIFSKSNNNFKTISEILVEHKTHMNILDSDKLRKSHRKLAGNYNHSTGWLKSPYPLN